MQICNILCKYAVFCAIFNMRPNMQYSQLCYIKNRIEPLLCNRSGDFLLTEVITLIELKSRKGCHTTSWKARCFKCQIYWKITQLYNIQPILAFLQKYHIFSSQNSILYCFIDPVLKHPHTSCFGRRQKVAINIDKP